MKKTFLTILYRFLAFCSRIYIKRNKIFSIGITGSVGKTTCRTIISQILESPLLRREETKGWVVYTSPKNYNSELGLVFSIFQIEDYIPSFKNLLILSIKIFFVSLFGKKKYDVIVLEYGIDRPNDMDFLLTINRPDIAIFTKLDYVHSEFFGGKESVLNEKFKMIYSAQKKAYVNNNDKIAQEKFSVLIFPQNKKIEKEYFWRETDCQNYKLVNKENTVFAEFDTLGKHITTNAIGEANMYYINLGLRILNDVDKNMEEKKGGTQGSPLQEKNIHLELSGQKARFSVLEGINNSILIDSTYNAGPAAMKKIIEDTKLLHKKLYPNYKLGFCLGDMREIGPTSDQLHRDVYNQIKDSDFIVCSNPEMKKNFGEKAHKFNSSRDAGEFLKNFLEDTTDKYVILFKGSQNTVFMEEALEKVLKNKQDRAKLCRQENFWKADKEEYFNSLEK